MAKKEAAAKDAKPTKKDKAATAVLDKPKAPVTTGQWGIKTKNTKTCKAGNTPRKGPVCGEAGRMSPDRVKEKAFQEERKKASYVPGVEHGRKLR